jgi:hypothetical protein
VWSQTGIYIAFLFCDRKSSHRLAKDAICLLDRSSDKLLMTCEGCRVSRQGQHRGFGTVSRFLKCETAGPRLLGDETELSGTI